MRKTRAFKLCIGWERLKIEETLHEVCLIGRVLVIAARVFILSKHTCGYDVKNMSAQDNIGLHVIFIEYINSASYLLGTHDISFYEFLCSFYLSFLIQKSSILQFEILRNSGIYLLFFAKWRCYKFNFWMLTDIMWIKDNKNSIEE
jgi:hypothetical protein